MKALTDIGFYATRFYLNIIHKLSSPYWKIIKNIHQSVNPDISVVKHYNIVYRNDFFICLVRFFSYFQLKPNIMLWNCQSARFFIRYWIFCFAASVGRCDKKLYKIGYTHWPFVPDRWNFQQKKRNGLTLHKYTHLAFFYRFLIATNLFTKKKFSSFVFVVFVTGDDYYGLITKQMKHRWICTEELEQLKII